MVTENQCDRRQGSAQLAFAARLVPLRHLFTEIATVRALCAVSYKIESRSLGVRALVAYERANQDLRLERTTHQKIYCLAPEIRRRGTDGGDQQHGAGREKLV